MRRAPRVRCLIVDIGGVLLNDGWDRYARKRAVAAFKLDAAAFEDRHHQVFGPYEEGRLTLDFYLDHAVFHQKRPFTRAQFRAFMFGQSKAMPGMIELVAGLKRRHGLKVVVLSNEARELNAHRIQAFKLGALADVFVSSSFVELRKPDPAIYRLALDLSQTAAGEALCLENTLMFVQVARGLGIRGIQHKDLQGTRAAFRAAGLD